MRPDRGFVGGRYSAGEVLVNIILDLDEAVV